MESKTIDSKITSSGDVSGMSGIYSLSVTTKKPNLRYTYDEWLESNKKNSIGGLSKSIEEVSKDTSTMLLYTLKGISFSPDSCLTNVENIHRDYLERKMRLDNIEIRYTDICHEIAYLVNSSLMERGGKLAPIYTRIGKLVCQQRAIEGEFMEFMDVK